MRNKLISLIAIICLILCLSLCFIPLQVFGTTISCKKRIPMSRFKLTAYCPCCDCSDDFYIETATGTTAKEGRTIAVDPDVIPYGSQVLIGDTVYIAEDCGAKVTGDHIDIYFDDHSDVEAFGVKYCDIWIIEGEWEQ